MRMPEEYSRNGGLLAKIFRECLAVCPRRWRGFDFPAAAKAGRMRRRARGYSFALGTVPMGGGTVASWPVIFDLLRPAQRRERSTGLRAVDFGRADRRSACIWRRAHAFLAAVLPHLDRRALGSLAAGIAQCHSGLRALYLESAERIGRHDDVWHIPDGHRDLPGICAVDLFLREKATATTKPARSAAGGSSVWRSSVEPGCGRSGVISIQIMASGRRGELR